VVAAPSPSRVLSTKIELALGSVGSIYERFWARSDASQLFAARQLRTYDLARASVGLMQAAAARCEALGSSDPVAGPLAGYLRVHIEEERGHDLWLLEDLEALGMPRLEVLSRHPSLIAACLVGSQYYWIHHDHPVALLGYMAVLEGCLPSEERLEDLVGRAGIPRSGARTLLQHARIDHEHRCELYALIDALPLSARQLASIGISALHTVSSLAALTEEAMEEAEGAAAQRPPAGSLNRVRTRPRVGTWPT
jgi:hypothetical protein